MLIVQDERMAYIFIFMIFLIIYDFKVSTQRQISEIIQEMKNKYH